MSLKDQVGSFCWWSLMTKDVKKANTFYQQLFDWTCHEREIPGEDNATIYIAGKGSFANPVPLESSFPAPSHWISYITVENVDIACKQAKKLGGQVCTPAFDIPTVGRTAVITDPAGAVFHLFTPADDKDNLDMIGDRPGETCWMELMVDDLAPLLPFYRELFGWKFLEPMPMTGGDYVSFEINGNNVGGLLKRPPSMPKMPPLWKNYFLIDSVEAASTKAESLGGKIIMPKTEVPNTGFFAYMEDPTGAHAYLFEPI